MIINEYRGATLSIGELGMRNVVSLHCDSEREVAHGSHGFHGFFFVASNGLIHINSHSKENMHELGFNFLYPMLLAITVYASSAEFLLGQFPSPASLSDGADGKCTGK